MRFVILTSSYPRYAGDGAAPFIRSIAEALVDRGHEVSVVAPFDIAVSQASLASRVKVRRFRYVWPPKWHVLGHGRSLVDDRRLRWLAFIVLPLYMLVATIHVFAVSFQQRADWLYAHWVLPNGPIVALVAWLQRKPYLISLHGSDGFVAQQHPLFGAVARLALRRAALVTACSPELVSIAVAHGADRARTHLWTYGVNIEIFRPSELVRGARQQPWGWSVNDKVLLAVGRLVSKKGFGVLLDAMPSIARHEPSVILAIAGEGSLRPVLERQAQMLGSGARVQFLGRIAWNEMPALLSAADVFVLPSVRDESGNMDGLPNVVLEAMACGVPVIASRLGGVTSILDEAGGGCLVPAGEKDALAEAAVCLLRDNEQRQRYGSAARKFVEDHLTWDLVAYQLVEWLTTAGKS
jgi:glycosyltransferase involved in cell wall biosynthesis